MTCIPLTATPLGWLLLGLGGYALYRTGKKRGAEEKAASCIAPLPDPPANESSKTMGGE